MIKSIIISITVVFAFSCTNNSKKLNVSNKVKNTRFYDFNIVVSRINPFLGIESKYFYITTEYFDENGELINTQNLRQNTLYHVNFLNSILKQKKGNRIIAPDTIALKVSRQDIDSIYFLTTDFLSLGEYKNITNDSTPPPPPSCDGSNYRVELNLGFRGKKYIEYLNCANQEDRLKLERLVSYLDKLKNSR